MENAQTDYENYVKKYCTKHRLSFEEAEKHELIRNVKSYYFDGSPKDDNRVVVE